jgi:3-hydroxybutyryl-CoA dehydrogenase
MSNGKTLPKAVAVIGAGTMGNGIAQVFATAGVPTYLVDVQQSFLDRGLATIDKSLQKFADKGTLTAEQAAAARARLATTTDMGCLAEVELCIEAVTENLEVKRQVFATADRTLPAPAILASNTSSISITVLAARTGRADRVIGMHFMNPVPLMTLVELIRGQATSAESMRVASELSVALGKRPVEAADYPGFIANRVLMPMINEAIYAVMEGVGSAEAIDTVMKLGMNHPMGPLTLADFIGLDVCLAILNVLHDGLGDPKYRPCPLLRRMVAAGHLGRKSGQGFYTYQP